MRELNDYIKRVTGDIENLSITDAKAKYAAFADELISILFEVSDKFRGSIKRQYFYFQNGCIYLSSFFATEYDLLNHICEITDEFNNKATCIHVLQMVDAFQTRNGNYVVPAKFHGSYESKIIFHELKRLESFARTDKKKELITNCCKKYLSEMKIETSDKPDLETASSSSRRRSLRYSFCKNYLPRKLEKNTVYLQVIVREILEDEDEWDEYLSGETTFVFNVFITENDHEHFIGKVQIIDTLDEYSALREWIRNEETIKGIDSNYISIGDVGYYRNIREQIFFRECFREFRDLPYNLKKFQKSDSIKQAIRDRRNLEKYRRIAHGEAELTNYYFTYQFPKENTTDNTAPSIPFVVDQTTQQPPTNVHVLIGANGSGKTTLLRRMALLALDSNLLEGIGTLVFEKEPPQKSLKKREKKKALRAEQFSKVLYISYSYFDAAWEMKNLYEKYGEKYRFIGLESKDASANSPVDLEYLTNTFKDSYEKIYRDWDKSEQWEETLKTVASNSSFAEFEQFRATGFLDDFVSLKESFLRLSAGHKSVMLTLLKLIDLVEERTLVLFDEPEEHLHPPLVSGFIRAISEILVKKNGVGIIATHSPVIVQEVPKKCVWIIRRINKSVDVSHPGIETFGESLGTITNYIFGYEIEDTGFHKLIQDVVSRKGTYEEALACFNGELGDEGRSILFSLMALKAQKND